MDTAGIAGFSMTGNLNEFRKFSRVPVEGRIRFWTEKNGHREPSNSSYQRSIKINGHNIIYAEPNDYEHIVACANCNRGVEVSEITQAVERYILGYFFENPCA